jgi:hypothetical protein
MLLVIFTFMESSVIVAASRTLQFRDERSKLG